jgi:hypothetical protein
MQAHERPLRRLRWLLLISGLGFDSLAAHRVPSQAHIADGSRSLAPT